jgi:hypothetical protein
MRPKRDRLIQDDGLAGEEAAEGFGVVEFIALRHQ